ncbi:Zn(II)2Cys6 transcription factor [Aspergillus mulundensis]|uniref:Zn(2)-C6 fungal-type domain-containing protein n=1 Tax=Aspergillus mulundensis TaxID=1810919 RepID=A0A3D8R404_9EURO|nr:hypothetical protein DSM5745_08476 [Aspergillus mulundensis]RDW68716.1 hypothetical protein DSM5745_08476 [Aspergillus mulundensis]
MSDQRQIPKNRLKTRSKWSTLSKAGFLYLTRIKCDETHPNCNQCTRRGFACPGYRRPLKWSSKYEFRGDEPRTRNRSSSSRELLAYTTPCTAIDDPSSRGFPTPIGSSSSLDPSILFGTGSANVFSTHGVYQNPNLDLSSALPDIQLPGDSPNSIDWTGWVNHSAPLHIPMALEDEDTGISRHYFVQVCRINSCVDSERNFFRAEIGSLMASSPLVYHCVLSMSAAHLTGLKSTMATSALDHRAKAQSLLRSTIPKLRNSTGADRSGSSGPTEALLGSILLGMTESWHNPSYLGTTHIHGARALFKQWITTASHGQSDGLRDTMTGIMTYWEAMSSFVVNQSLDEMSYLDFLCHQKPSDRIRPNPWTGISTPLFVYLARVGTLARQRLLLSQLSKVTSREDATGQLQAGLLRSARETESALVLYQVPPEDLIDDPADPVTTVTHLRRIAQIYRLSALVELYRNFPDLLTPSPTHGLAPAAQVLAMAVSILNIIAAVPQSSGVNCLLTIPLIIAGSTLQSIRPLGGLFQGNKDQSAWETLSAELLLSSSQEDVQEHWRSFVRSRLQEVRRYVGLPAISRASEILEKVWARSDVQAAVGSSKTYEFVQWVEVMVEERLETILG